MKRLLLISLAVLFVIVVSIGGYFGYKTYKKYQFVNQCVSDLLVKHETSETTPAEHAANQKIAKKLCNCIYDQMQKGMPRFMAELGCAFEMMLE